MRRPNHSFLWAAALMVLAAVAGADPAPLPPVDSIPVPADTLAPPRDTLAADSVVLDPVLYQRGGDTVLIEAFAPVTVDTLRRTSPTVTMFKSVAFPGWGQWCNRKYLKAGIVFAIEAYFLGKYIHYARKASDWRDRWQAVPDSNTNEQSAAFNQYAEYRDSRNSNLWGVVVPVFLSMFDAYVDAHLRDFPPPVAGQTTVSWKSTPGNGASLALTYHF